MNEELKSQLVEELNRAIKPERTTDAEDDGRVQYRQSTHTLEINEEVQMAAKEDQKEKKPDEDEMFESLIQRLNEQKYGGDKTINMA